ncbi:transposable element Tc1 transposase [Trichonephila clavipes]|nr:transposable element Tc1 transposase [Trichonephila clavipes]
MQKETTDRQGRSHPYRCTTARDDRRIGLMAVMNRRSISRTIAQQIQSVAHDSAPSCTIRRRFQHNGMSTRRPLIRLPLTGNHKRLRRQ